MLYRAVGEPAELVKQGKTSTYQGPVEQLGVLATLSRWRPRVQIPSGPHPKSRRKAALLRCAGEGQDVDAGALSADTPDQPMATPRSAGPRLGGTR